MNLLRKTILLAADGLNKIFRKITIYCFFRFNKNKIMVDIGNQINLPSCVSSIIGSVVGISVNMRVNNGYSIYNM